MDHPEPQFPHLPHRLVALQVKRRSGTQFLASPAWVSSLPSTRRELLKPYLAGLGEKLRAQGVKGSWLPFQREWEVTVGT